MTQQCVDAEESLVRNCKLEAMKTASTAVVQCSSGAAALQCNAD